MRTTVTIESLRKARLTLTCNALERHSTKIAGFCLAGIVACILTAAIAGHLLPVGGWTLPIIIGAAILVCTALGAYGWFGRKPYQVSLRKLEKMRDDPTNYGLSVSELRDLSSFIEQEHLAHAAELQYE